MEIKSNYEREVILNSEEREVIQNFKAILKILLDIMKATGEDLKVESWDNWTIYSLDGLEKLCAEIEKFSLIALIKKGGEEINE